MARQLVASQEADQAGLASGLPLNDKRIRTRSSTSMVSLTSVNHGAVERGACCSALRTKLTPRLRSRFLNRNIRIERCTERPYPQHFSAQSSTLRGPYLAITTGEQGLN